MKKIQVIDLVRSLSILVVLSGHLQAIFVNNGSKIYPLEYLWYKFWLNHPFGVSVFFVVSGYLITRLLARDGPGLFKPDLRNFYSRRVGRIIPLLGLACLIEVAFTRLFDTQSPPFKNCFGSPPGTSTGTFWFYLCTFSANWYRIIHWKQTINLGLQFNIFWSLSIEEQFYLFYPFILSLLGKERNLYCFLALMILLGPLSLILGYHLLPYNNIVLQNSFAAFNLIAMGCLLYLVSERLQNSLRARKVLSLLLCASGILIFLVFYTHVYVRGDDTWEIWANSMVGVGTFLFLLGGLHLDLFEGKTGAFLGFPGKLS